MVLLAAGGTGAGGVRRLGVFPASFDEAAAVAVCAGDGIERWDVIDALASLVAKSLVGADESGEATRYQLLETLRHFARDRAAGSLDDLRRRHAAHYAAFAEEAGPGLASPDELRWRPRVTADLDNLRAAASWAFDAPDVGDLVLGVRVIDGLAPDSPGLYSTGMSRRGRRRSGPDRSAQRQAARRRAQRREPTSPSEGRLRPGRGARSTRSRRVGDDHLRVGGLARMVANCRTRPGRPSHRNIGARRRPPARRAGWRQRMAHGWRPQHHVVSRSPTSQGTRSPPAPRRSRTCASPEGSERPPCWSTP